MWGVDRRIHRCQSGRCLSWKWWPWFFCDVIREVKRWKPPDVKAKTLFSLLADVAARLTANILKYQSSKISSERSLTLSSKSPDHLAKLLHALILSCVQETEFRCLWTLRPDASGLKLNIFSHRNLFGLKFYFYLCLWIRTHVVFDSGQRLQLQ